MDDRIKELFLTSKGYDFFHHGKDASNGLKISIAGKKIEDVFELYDRLFYWLKSKGITFKIATNKRVTIPNSEQSKKLLTIYVPNEYSDEDFQNFLAEIENKLSGYKGWHDIKLPLNLYQVYSGGIQFRNDRDENGEYIPANRINEIIAEEIKNIT